MGLRRWPPPRTAAAELFYGQTRNVAPILHSHVNMFTTPEPRKSQLPPPVPVPVPGPVPVPPVPLQVWLAAGNEMNGGPTAYEPKDTAWKMMSEQREIFAPVAQPSFCDTVYCVARLRDFLCDSLSSLSPAACAPPRTSGPASCAAARSAEGSAYERLKPVKGPRRVRCTTKLPTTSWPHRPSSALGSADGLVEETIPQVVSCSDF